MSEELFVKLRDCFTAGYTLPQYCIDNGIKKPLFVSEEKYKLFLWEINAQFKCDRRLLAQFCFIDIDEAYENIHFSKVNGVAWIVGDVTIKNFSSLNLNAFDKIILLTNANVEVNREKIVSLAALERFCVRQTVIDIPLRSFLQRYPQVKIVQTNFPFLEQYKDGLEFSKSLQEYPEIVKAIKNGEGKHVNNPFDGLGYTNSQVVELLKRATTMLNPDGSTTMTDDAAPLIRIHNGKRMTAYQPVRFQNRIYVFGTCYQYGFQAPFDKTIESYLQKMLNEANLPYRVENEGQFYWNRFQDMFYNLNALSPAPDDIILINFDGNRSNDRSLPFCDVSDAFDPPHDYREIFCTKRHVNELGYKLVAEKYFKFLTENNFFREVYFNYPTPPPVISQIWYTSAIRGRRHKKYRKRGVGSLQATA